MALAMGNTPFNIHKMVSLPDSVAFFFPKFPPRLPVSGAFFTHPAFFKRSAMLYIKLDRVDAFADLTGHLTDAVEVIQRIVGADHGAQMRTVTPDQAVVLTGFGGEITGEAPTKSVQRVECIAPLIEEAPCSVPLQE